MSDFTKLQKDKILNYLFKNFKKIDFDNIDQDISLKKIDDLHFFDKQELLIKISDLLFEDLDKKFLSEVNYKGLCLSANKFSLMSFICNRYANTACNTENNCVQD